MASVGKPQSRVEVKIDNSNGEILMRGPFLMDGYYKRKELTDETLRGGWLHTGDKGFIDEDNYLHITGRVVDSFKTSKGKYIEPLTLEYYFGDIKELEEVCVAGLGMSQPLCLAQLSDIGREMSKEDLTNMLTEKFNEINSGLENYKKMSTLIIVKDKWTEENNAIGPTLKIKRGTIDKMYSSNYESWEEDKRNVIWE